MVAGIGYCTCLRFTISNERRGAVRFSAARHGQAATIRDVQGLLPPASGSNPLGSLGGHSRQRFSPSTSPRLRVAETRHLGARLRDSRLQVGGRVTGRGCLGSMLLGLAKLGDGSGQGDELGHERDGHQRVVASEVPGQRDHPGGAP